MATAPRETTTSSQQTSSTEEETNIKAVSYSGGKYCYSIGCLVGQEFSAMKKPDPREWREDAPNWRVAVGGLNLEGKQLIIIKLDVF
jgi:hypothetical protein